MNDESSNKSGLLSIHTDAFIQTDQWLQSILESEDEESIHLLSRNMPVNAEASPESSEHANSSHYEPPAEDPVGHVVVTLIILGITFSTPILVPGVAAVWSIFGSSMVLFISIYYSNSLLQ